MAELPPLPSGIVVNYFIVSDDVERSARFYTEVLGGRVVFSPVPTVVELSNTFIVINAGGGPTDDKPAVTLETPRDPGRASCGRSRNSQACAHVIPQVLALVLFYLMSSFPVGMTRPGLLFGR